MENSKSVLIVDDVPENIGVLSKMLEREGYKLRVAKSGEEAINSVSAQAPNLILLDIQMPGISGYETCKQIKSMEEFNSIPIIFISALNESFNKILAYEVGGQDYISKPFQAEEVVARVRTHVKMHEYQQQLESLNIELYHQLESSFEQAAIGIAHVDVETQKLIKVNKYFCSIIGFESAELLTKSIMEISHPDFIESDKQDLQDLLKGKSPTFTKEKQYVRKEGSIVWGKVTVSLVEPKDKNISKYFLAFVEDVTEKKHAQEQVQKLSEAVEQSPMYVVITDKDGIIEYVNPAFQEITGFSKEEALGNKPGIIKSGYTPDSVYIDLWDSILHGKVWKGELENKRKDGTNFWESATISPIFNSEGEVSNFVAVKEDITERKKMEEELHTTQLHYTDFINSSSDAVSYWKMPDGLNINLPVEKQLEMLLQSECVDTNRVTWETYGFKDKTELVGKRLNELEIEVSENKAFYELIKNGYKLYNFETEVTTAGGEVKYVSESWYGVVKEDELKNIWVNTVIITEQKLAEKKIKELNKQIEEENIYLKEEIKLENNFNEIIGQSAALKNMLNQVEMVSKTDSTVLITGNTGTGKELIARAIHEFSDRKNKTLVKVNCSALPAELIESELFGHEKGAFTTALAKKIGRFELADGGTLFLDEIGDFPLSLQPKLLRVLQEGEFERVGGTKTIKVNVRIIAATNRNIEEMAKSNEFRSDLYFRLNVFPIYSPELKERTEDIPLLVNHFIKIFNKKTGKEIKSVPKKALLALETYSWPGNIRELEHVIERAVIVSKSDKLELGTWFGQESDKTNDIGFVSMEEYEKRYILEVLESTEWKIRGKNGASEILGLKPTTLESRMKKLGIKK